MEMEPQEMKLRLKISIPGDDIYDNSTSVSGMEIYETGSEPCINYTKELNNNILKVVVKAASFRK